MGKARAHTSMLWSGKLYIVRVTADAYAMVGVSACSVRLHLENARSEKDVVTFKNGSFIIFK